MSYLIRDPNFKIAASFNTEVECIYIHSFISEDATSLPKCSGTVTENEDKHIKVVDKTMMVKVDEILCLEFILCKWFHEQSSKQVLSVSIHVRKRKLDHEEGG